MKLGIVGHGFVGSAVDHGFTRKCTKFIVDPKKNNNTIQQLNKFKPDATFVCVPTPQKSTGEVNAETLEKVCDELNEISNLVIIKSTVPGYVLEKITQTNTNLNIVYNPEFLTEKNYIQDFQNPPMHVFGGMAVDTNAVWKIYREHSTCRKCPVYHTDMMTASFVKYAINSFLATKVTFFNELHDTFLSAGGKDFSKLTKMIATDKRIGKTHMSVPGNDGQRGYAGSCFPKDTNALAWFAREILDTPFTQLETSIEINERLRKTNQS